MDVPARRTLAGEGTGQLQERRSRFLALARPLSAEELEPWLSQLRSQHTDARHIVHAWRGAQGQSRSSDDGEPSGTGGTPCLGALDRLGLVDSAVAVVRWYGGVPLGAANLARAYGRAAQGALAAAPVRVLLPGYAFRLLVPFWQMNAVQRHLNLLGAREVERVRTEGGVGVSGWLPEQHAAALREAVADATAGHGEVELAQGLIWR